MTIKTHVVPLSLTLLATSITWMVSSGVFLAAAGIELPPNDPDELMSPIGSRIGARLRAASRQAGTPAA